MSKLPNWFDTGPLRPFFNDVEKRLETLEKTKVEATLPPANQFTPAPTAGPTSTGRPTMRGLSRLKNLTESLMASVDAEADKAAAEIQKDHDEAMAAVASVKQVVGGAFKSTTADINDMLSQTTNEATTTAAAKPPLVSPPVTVTK